MVAETDIINVALRNIGGSRIDSLDDGSTNANIARDIYAELRDNLLRSHPWNFATKRQKLAQSSTTPTFEFDYGYPLPNDWLRTISVHDNDAGTSTVYHKMEQHDGVNCIMCSSNEVWLRYVAQVTDPNKMTADFRYALENALSRDMAIPVASSNTMQDSFTTKARRALSQARSSDGMGGFPERRPRGSWIETRSSWRPRVRVEGS